MQKRLAKEARDQEKQAKALAAGKKIKDSNAKTGRGRGDTSFFKVTCKVLTANQTYTIWSSLFLTPFL